LCGYQAHDATPSELRLRRNEYVFPGLPKRNPGLELANAFSVVHARSLKGCQIDSGGLRSAATTGYFRYNPTGLSEAAGQPRPIKNFTVRLTDLLMS
jgi:hypothetical protein